tara:strand:- start:7799 stop:8014 length:216 start_codon:yes stop_codon:yes gene_type:complete
MTIIYYGVELQVDYKHCAEEPMIMYYGDGTGYPGSPAEVELLSTEVNGVDITDILLEKQIEEIENIILDKL